MKRVIFVFMVFPGFCGCGSFKKSTSQQAEEAKWESRQWQMRSVAVPASRTCLEIPLADGLKPLPQGAVYRNRDRQARVLARVARDTLYIEASCDSLQQLVWEYEHRLANTKTVENREEKQREGAWYRPLCVFLLACGLLGAIRRQ